jgi:hypothetical protein
MVVNGSDKPGAAEENKMERNAGRTAHKASQTEQKHDEDRDIFSN